MNALHCHFGRLALRSSAGETWRIYGGHGLVDRQPVALTGIQMESGQKSTGNLTRIYRKSDQDLPEIGLGFTRNLTRIYTESDQDLQEI
jgi:hypothetical protein